MKLGLVLLIGVAACGGDDGAGTPAIDAPPRIDAIPPAFVGRWREIPVFPEPEGDRAILTVGADFSFDTLDGGATTHANWRLEADGRITITTAGRASTGDYFVDATNFTTDALLPMGAVDGVVGTWITTSTMDNLTIASTMVLDADTSYTYTRVRPGATDQFIGTWTIDGASIFLDGTFNGNPSHIYVQAIPGLALGTPLYERLP